VSTPPAASEEARIHAPGVATPCRVSQPASGDVVVGEPGEGREEGVAALAESVDRASGRRCRVVDLVGEAGGEGPEGHERVALTHGRLDGARGAVQAADEVAGQGEPVVHQLAQLRSVESQQPPWRRASTGRHVDAVVVPRPEPARPSAGHVHAGYDDVLATDLAHQVERAGQQYPPVVRAVTLGEHHVAGAEGDLVAAAGELGQVVVGQPGEQVDAAQLVDVHGVPPGQTVAR
jgi:hypothetical protein